MTFDCVHTPQSGLKCVIEKMNITYFPGKQEKYTVNVNIYE